MITAPAMAYNRIVAQASSREGLNEAQSICSDYGEFACGIYVFSRTVSSFLMWLWIFSLNIKCCMGDLLFYSG